MAKLPKFDARFLDLAEADTLTGYSIAMGDLLRHRWAQHELQINRDFARRDLPEVESDMEMQAEQAEHLWFEQLLGAQVLLSSWALLQGAVIYCSEYLAEKGAVAHLLRKPDKWPQQLTPTNDMPAELQWKRYYEDLLKVRFPLQAKLNVIRDLRRLRNDYAHTLQLYDLRTGYRDTPYERLQQPMSKEAIERFGDDPFTGNYPGRVFAEFAGACVKELREHVEELHPHDGEGILFWNRRRR